MTRNFFLMLISLWYMTVSAQHNDFPQNVSSFTLDSKDLGGKRTVWVYLPYNYDTTERNFPVIYMHDGQNLFNSYSAYSQEWYIDEKLDSLKAQCIIIGIEHGGDKRPDELAPYKNDKFGGGEGDNYLSFLVNVVKPYVDANYRTLKDRDNTVIFGSSLGGLISFYAVIKYPKIFGKAGVFSPSFWFNPEIYDLVHTTERINAKIYFMAGDHESSDMVLDIERMEELIKPKLKSKKHFHKKIIHNGRHNEKLWANEFDDAYLWLIGND